MFLKLYGNARAKNDTYNKEEFIADMSALAADVATKFEAAGTIHRGMNLPDCCGMWLNGVPENRATLLADRARNTLTGYSTSQKWFRDKIGKMNADSIVATLTNMCN